MDVIAVDWNAVWPIDNKDDVASNITDDKNGQLLNAPLPIVFTVFGIVIVDITHDWNAVLLIVCKDDDDWNVIDDKLLPILLNALIPIDVTEFGIVIVVIGVDWNA